MLGFSRSRTGMRLCPRSELVTGHPSARLEAFARIAREGAAHPAVRAAARRCWALTARGRAERVAELVQALPYLDDPPGSADTVRAPCETLEVGGDCDCRTVLAAALLLVLDVPHRLAWIVQRGHPLDHVLCQVYLGLRWEWLDVTVPGARVGEHPAAAVARVGYARRVTGG